MQFSQIVERTQLPLFQGAILCTDTPLAIDPLETAWTGSFDFSELALQGSPENCLHLLAPILRELSRQDDERWLTLVNAPPQLTQTWLRSAGLRREAILLLQTRGEQTAVQLTCEALRLGRSHRVISWINPLGGQARQMLNVAAQQGQTQSLNIRLG